MKFTEFKRTRGKVCWILDWVVVEEWWRRCSAITRPDLTTEQTAPAPFPPPPPPFPLPPPPPPRPLPPTIFPSPTIPNHHSLLFNSLSTYSLLPWNPLSKLFHMLSLEIPLLTFPSSPFILLFWPASQFQMATSDCHSLQHFLTVTVLHRFKIVSDF